mmetsp:Transcript_100156/g.172962  ORF Transcript_100156/g.172962 Transcript_100156/m.172962 type:complete len:361 (-) Transcript_100156:1630-2712(-)
MLGMAFLSSQRPSCCKSRPPSLLVSACAKSCRTRRRWSRMNSSLANRRSASICGVRTGEAGGRRGLAGMLDTSNPGVWARETSARKAAGMPRPACFSISGSRTEGRRACSGQPRERAESCVRSAGGGSAALLPPLLMRLTESGPTPLRDSHVRQPCWRVSIRFTSRSISSQRMRSASAAVRARSHCRRSSSAACRCCAMRSRSDSASRIISSSACLSARTLSRAASMSRFCRAPSRWAFSISSRATSASANIFAVTCCSASICSLSFDRSASSWPSAATCCCRSNSTTSRARFTSCSSTRSWACSSESLIRLLAVCPISWISCSRRWASRCCFSCSAIYLCCSASSAAFSCCRVASRALT